MACQGPSQEYAHRQANEAFEEIWKLLESKYGFTDYEKNETWKGMFYKDWRKSKDNLKESLRDLFWKEACQSY